jgi:hypothetical protein
MVSMAYVASMASCLSELESVSDWPCTADISCWCCWCCCWREDISHYYSGIYHISNTIQLQVQLGLCTPRSQDESNRSNRSAQMCPVWDRTRIHSKTSTKHEVGLGWQKRETVVFIFHMLAEPHLYCQCLGQLHVGLLLICWTKRLCGCAKSYPSTIILRSYLQKRMSRSAQIWFRCDGKMKGNVMALPDKQKQGHECRVGRYAQMQTHRPDECPRCAKP